MRKCRTAGAVKLIVTLSFSAQLSASLAFVTSTVTGADPASAASDGPQRVNIASAKVPDSANRHGRTFVTVRGRVRKAHGQPQFPERMMLDHPAAPKYVL